MKITITIAYLISVAIFIVVAGYDEFSIMSGAKTYDQAGHSRLLTQQEIWRDARYAAVGSIPFAFAACALLFASALWFRRSLRRLHPAGAMAFAGVVGLLAGGLLSFIVYATVGGWAPPALRPAAVSGALLFASAAWFRGPAAGASANHTMELRRRSEAPPNSP